MLRRISLLTIACLLQIEGLGVAADKPQHLIPPAPAPANSKDVTPPVEGAGELAVARRSLKDGRFELAVQAASRVIAQDPKNSAAKAIRADAYTALGRYEEALSDHKPLEVIVAAPRADLMSGTDVVATVPRGTKLLVEDVQDEWLKVISAGDKNFKWAWVEKSDLAIARPSSVERRDVERRDRVDAMILPFDRRSNGPGPGLRYYGDPGDPYGGYGPRYHDYGRRSYDWWQHVPPRYWGYLPR